MKRRNIISVLACSIVAFAFTACTDVWEEHYQPNPELNADETLWELIENDPSLTEFAKYLKATGYDTLLTKNRSYTVWAPVDEGFAYNETNTALWEKEFVQNHIADYSHVAGGRLSEDNRVKMLNGKYIGFENAKSGKFTFKGNPLTEQNIPAKNGILHKVNGHAEFTANIWEQLAKESSLDSLRNFLYKDYKREPNWNASVQGPVKDGKIEYLDTAWTVTCPWFSSLGRLNREDSSYTMFAPTNQAWNELYEDTKRYFNYSKGFGTKGDSIRDVVVKEFMVRNLVFSDKVNKRYATGNEQYPYDSLVSNYNYAYSYEPLVFGTEEVRDLYDGLTMGKSLSNGTLNIVDKVNYDPLLCWHDTISMEGENLFGDYSTEDDNDFESATKEVTIINRDSLMYDSISGGAVGVYDGGNDNPRLYFNLRNVLSARYEVKIVVVSPEKLSRYDTTYIKPNKFLATLTCGDSELKDAVIQISLGRKDSCSVRGRDIYSIPGRIDTITLVPLVQVDDTTYIPAGVDYVEIPTCEYNEESLLDGGGFQTRLEIVSNLGNGGKDFTYKRNYLKDKEKYIQAIRDYNAAVEAKKLKLEELENSELSDEDKAEILEDLDEDIEDAQEDLEKERKKVEKMDQDYGTYLDNTLRIDQVILVPVRFDE